MSVQEMAVDIERLAGLWSGLQSVLVPTVPASLKCSGLHLPLSPAGCSAVSNLQQRAAITVS